MPDSSALTWDLAFPCLRVVSGRGGEDGVDIGVWREEPLVQSADVTRDRLGQIVSLVTEGLPNWPLGQVFPFVSGEIPILAIPDLNVRSVNGLRRTFGDSLSGVLADSTTDLFDIQQLGAGSINVVLRSIARLNLEAALHTSDRGELARGDVSFAQPWIPFARVVAPDVATSSAEVLPAEAVTALRILARWQLSRGKASEPLLDITAIPGSPAAVEEAWEVISSLKASDILHEDIPRAAEVLGAEFGQLDERELLIARQRLLSDTPATLDEIGQELGVTRERVRQVESRLKAELGNRRLSDFGTPTGDLAAAVRQRVGTIATLGRLLREFPDLEETVAVVGHPAWRVLDWLDDDLEIEGQWVTCPSIAVVHQDLTSRLTELSDAFGVVAIDDFVRSFGSANLPSDEVEPLVGWLGGEISGDRILTRVSNLSDRAAAVLSIHGVPMTAEEIVAHLGVDRTPGSLRNAVSLDGRFHRADRDRWGLVAWGGESYTGIRDMIRKEIETEGKPVQLADLVEKLTSRFGVSPSSVMTYAAAPPFAVIDGAVRWVGEDTVGPRKSPARTRNLYRVGDGWNLRITVTNDLLRGSGFPLPVALASILGLRSGSSRELRSSVGHQRVGWAGAQPNCASIRRFLLEADVEAGEQVLLWFGDDASFACTVVRLPDGAVASDHVQALTGIVGVGDIEWLRKEMSTAFGLPPGSPWSSLIGAAQSRGEDALYEQMLNLQVGPKETVAEVKLQTDPSVSEILDLI